MCSRVDRRTLNWSHAWNSRFLILSAWRLCINEFKKMQPSRNCKSSISISRHQIEIERTQFRSPGTRSKLNAPNFDLLPSDRNPTRPISISCHQIEIQRDQFRSPAISSKSNATNFDLPASDRNPTRPISISIENRHGNCWK